MYIYIYIVIPTGGNGRSRPQPKNLFILPNLEKFLPSRLPPSHQFCIPPTTKQQLSSYNPIKAAFLAVVIALASFFF